MTTAQVVETSVTVTNSSFQNYTHPDDHTTRTTDTPGFKPFTIFKFQQLEVKEVEETLKEINTRKTTGWDFIPPKALRFGAEELSIPLTTLFNTCIKQGNWPNDWKKLRRMDPCSQGR